MLLRDQFLVYFDLEISPGLETMPDRASSARKRGLGTVNRTARARILMRGWVQTPRPVQILEFIGDVDAGVVSAVVTLEVADTAFVICVTPLDVLPVLLGLVGLASSP